MKTLKLEHQLAQMVLKGTKTSTWRLFDDKNLAVGDELQLIDKVDPRDQSTWVIIGTGIITQVIKVRLGDITAEQAVGHETFSSPEVMLKTYQGYYGSGVTLATEVKIIHFAFKPLTQQHVTIQQDEVSALFHPEKIVRLYADGGSRGNPGPSASGFVLYDMDNEILIDKGIYLGVTTNNQAEYQALKLGLEAARQLHAREVNVYMDSLLVVNQMKSIFKVKNRDLWPIHEAVKELVGTFKTVSFTHVPRELNKAADAAVNRALDEALGLQKAL